jgi:hypothetical protein
MLLPRPEFQRRLVWTDKDKSEFIRTVLQEYPFPEIYIAAGSVDVESGSGTEMLVDGQQRVTTLYQYFTGAADFKLARGLPSYRSLPEDTQRKFLEYEVVVRDLGPQNLEVIKEIFTRINSTSYSLNAFEIQNARFHGAFKQSAERVSQHRLFEEKKIFSPAEIRRMQDVQYAAVLLVTLLSSYINRNSGLKDFMERYNNEFPEGRGIERDLSSVFEFIESLGIDPQSRAWNAAELFTLIVELYRLIKAEQRVIDVHRAAAALNTFYESVTRYVNTLRDPHDILRRDDEIGIDQETLKIREYYRSSIQATNDRSNRIKRGEIVGGLLRAVAQA